MLWENKIKKWIRSNIGHEIEILEFIYEKNDYLILKNVK
jgi:hypothetical protein